MGNRFEVYAWRMRDYVYSWEQEYAGDSLEDALLVMYKLKEKGEACVKIEWR